MIQSHILGFPRIGDDRQLKHALECYWRGEYDATQLLATAKQLRKQAWQWQQQAGLDFVSVGDFSLYDHILDLSIMLGVITPRYKKVLSANTTTTDETFLDKIFLQARGRTADGRETTAGELTKWFNTNYHYIVPEFSKETSFELNATRLVEEIKEAQAANLQAKPVVVGPITYLYLGKTKDNSNKWELLDELVIAYTQLFDVLAKNGIDWVQLDEPILVTELNATLHQAFVKTYNIFSKSQIKILLTSYFGKLKENIPLLCDLPIDGVHIDAVNNWEEVATLNTQLSAHKVLSIGAIDGRNIWKADLNKLLTYLQPIVNSGRTLWLASSCSLLHTPVDLSREKNMDQDIVSWLAFAVQKLDELRILTAALNLGKDTVAIELEANAQAIANRNQSTKVHDTKVKKRVDNINSNMTQRLSDYATRHRAQSELNLPLYPTTTIGSFPQTKQIRNYRSAYRKGEINFATYSKAMKNEIVHCVKEQEDLGLDVLVHGEAERNDMVEYFGEQLAGYVFSSFGWVQSYGSRCVKPPIIYGDISRPKPMTVDWITYAQSLTNKVMKGMLTGPVTILNWSFVRNDQPKSTTCLQLALAIRDEVLDLEKAGIRIIQIDEAALREGMPLRKEEWQSYLDWAIKSFRISANGVKNNTQIHTHMCYSEFNDIITALSKMDADVITIEAARSDMELLDVFDKGRYFNQIGPGVYDIHSPNVPSVDSIIDLLNNASGKIPKHRLWVNPDCGLKTRDWQETRSSLRNMVKAAQFMRQQA